MNGIYTLSFLNTLYNIMLLKFSHIFVIFYSLSSFICVHTEYSTVDGYVSSNF